jgi:hypothetical protein
MDVPVSGCLSLRIDRLNFLFRRSRDALHLGDHILGRARHLGDNALKVRPRQGIDAEVTDIRIGQELWILQHPVEGLLRERANPKNPFQCCYRATYQAGPVPTSSCKAMLMPRYFFNTRIGADLISDPKGMVLRDPDHAWVRASSL